MQASERIKEYRNIKGLSQKEVALKIGIDQAQYSRIESGKVEPTVSSLEKIAEALEIEVGQFFGDQKPVDVNAYDKSLVEKLRLLEELDDTEKRTVFSVIDIAIAKKRLKDTLSNALQLAH